jgi:hypothetical protein
VSTGVVIYEICLTPPPIIDNHQQKHQVPGHSLLKIKFKIPRRQARALVSPSQPPPNNVLQDLVDQLESAKRQNTELKEQLVHNEEEIRWRREMLNHLLVEIEKEATEAWRMEQRLEVLQKMFHLMLEHRSLS